MLGTIGTTFFVFILVWWVVIFAVLPFGNKAPEEKVIGHASSAPANPRLMKKFLWTTAISIVITAAIMVWFSYSGFSVHEMVKAWQRDI